MDYNIFIDVFFLLVKKGKKNNNITKILLFLHFLVELCILNDLLFMFFLKKLNSFHI